MLEADTSMNIEQVSSSMGTGASAGEAAGGGQGQQGP